MPPNEDQKRIEAYILAAARAAGVPIPTGENRGVEPAPDFVFEHDKLGIELTELIRPAEKEGGFIPAAEEAFHKETVQLAQEQYFSAPGAKPARLVVYFSSDGGKKKDKCEMAEALSTFVNANVHLASPVLGFSSLKTPDGFGAISIASEAGDWWSGECGRTTLSQIQTQFGFRIRAKNKHVTQYRRTLPAGYRVWLLIYSGGLLFRFTCRFRAELRNGRLRSSLTRCFGSIV